MKVWPFGVALETERVDAARVGVQEVSGGLGDENAWPASRHSLRLERPAQIGHVCTQRADGLRWRTVAPELISQPIERYDTIDLQQQHYQDSALFGRTDLDEAPVGADLQRPEDPVRNHVPLLPQWAAQPYSRRHYLRVV